MAKRNTLVSEVFAEKIIYGGMVARRREVYDDAFRRLTAQERAPRATVQRMADMYAFGPQTVLATAWDCAHRLQLCEVIAHENA